MLIVNPINLKETQNQANTETIARAEYIKSLELARSVLVNLEIEASETFNLLRGAAECIENDSMLDSHINSNFEVIVSQLVIAAPTAFFVGEKDDTPVDNLRFDPDIPGRGKQLLQSFVELRQFLDDDNLSHEFRFQVQEMYSKVFAVVDLLNEIWNNLCEDLHLEWNDVQKLSRASSFRASEQGCAAVCYQIKFLDRSCKIALNRLNSAFLSAEMAEATLPNFSSESG